MLKIRAYNAAAAISLADYTERALCLRRGTTDRMAISQAAVAHSRVLMANIDTLIGELTSELTRKGWLWPAYRSAPGASEMEGDLLSAAHWRDSAQEALDRAETMRDAEARRMMREIAVQYEDLAALIENAVSRQDEPPQV
jgi:hypothetical protein